jgi:hypothetical protein
MVEDSHSVMECSCDTHSNHFKPAEAPSTKSESTSSTSPGKNFFLYGMSVRPDKKIASCFIYHIYFCTENVARAKNHRNEKEFSQTCLYQCRTSFFREFMFCRPGLLEEEDFYNQFCFIDLDVRKKQVLAHVLIRHEFFFVLIMLRAYC